MAVVDQEQYKSLFGSLEMSQNQILDFVAEFAPYKISPVLKQNRLCSVWTAQYNASFATESLQYCILREVGGKLEGRQLCTQSCIILSNDLKFTRESRTDGEGELGRQRNQKSAVSRTS